MVKKATNTGEQIELLKSRGLKLDYQSDKIEEILLDIGYYRLGFYWNPFEVDKNHNFKKGTSFSDIIKLYYFDANLRNILSKYINRIEINFRTKLIYHVSNKYKESPTWFADKNVVNEKITNDLKKYYNDKFIKSNKPIKRHHSKYINDKDKFIKSNKPIKRHHSKYINDKYAPAWKTLEFFTFGTILNIYRHLKDIEIKKQISKSFGIENIKKFINLLDTIREVRNTCAHGGVLFDFNTPKGIPVIPQIELKQDRNSIYSCIKVIYYFLGTISVNRKREMQDQINELFKQYKDNERIKNIIKNSMKYFQ